MYNIQLCVVIRLPISICKTIGLHIRSFWTEKFIFEFAPPQPTQNTINFMNDAVRKFLNGDDMMKKLNWIVGFVNLS